MTQLKPCARCEQELPLENFDYPEAFFCKPCMKEVTDIIRSKYSVIEAAHFRAQLRQKSKALHEKLKNTD